MEFAVVLAIGLLAGTISGIVGFGSSIMLMPVLVIAFGPREAVPVMAVAALMAGSFLAKPLVLKMNPAQFGLLMDGLLVVAGLTMLWAALA